MKIVGLIGGISWISTLEYYKHVNNIVNSHLGGLNSSHCVIYSLNYEDIKRNNDANDWDATFRMLLHAAKGLKSSGATAIALCANTMHVLADKLQHELELPVIHIASATAEQIVNQNIKKVGLLGTRFTMELDFFKGKLSSHGITTIIPNAEDRDFIHQTIFNELGKGIILEQTRTRYLAVIEELINNGAEGIILGCTEIPLLISQGQVRVPVFDTTFIHAKAIADFQLTNALAETHVSQWAN